MKIRIAAVVSLIISILIVGCSKKNIPEKSEKPATEKTVSKAPLIIKTRPTPTPKVITVNDAIAKKSVDGRLFYDLQKRRYWKNYEDGKYYLFYKGMYEDKAFKPR